jgi:hypothetical protein
VTGARSQGFRVEEEIAIYTFEEIYSSRWGATDLQVRGRKCVRACVRACVCEGQRGGGGGNPRGATDLQVRRRKCMVERSIALSLSFTLRGQPSIMVMVTSRRHSDCGQ